MSATVQPPPSRDQGLRIPQLALHRWVVFAASTQHQALSTRLFQLRDMLGSNRDFSSGVGSGLESPDACLLEGAYM
jgi:hypothetical protein